MWELSQDLKLKILKLEDLLISYGNPNFTRHLNIVCMLKKKTVSPYDFLISLASK